MNEPTRFQMAEMTPAQAAKFLANIAQVTAKGSGDWENFEKMVETMIISAMEFGRKFGRNEKSDV